MGLFIVIYKMFYAIVSFLRANPLLLQPPHEQAINSCSLSAVAECEYLLSWDFEHPWEWIRTVPQAMRQIGVRGRRISTRKAVERLEKWIPTLIVLYKRQDNGYEITSWDIRTPHAVCWVGMIWNKILTRFAEWENVGILWHYIVDKKAVDRFYSIELDS